MAVDVMKISGNNLTCNWLCIKLTERPIWTSESRGHSASESLQRVPVLIAKTELKMKTTLVRVLSAALVFW